MRDRGGASGAGWRSRFWGDACGRQDTEPIVEALVRHFLKAEQLEEEYKVRRGPRGVAAVRGCGCG